ncbi:MAG: SPOR domain-containing protein [Mucilaginibacter sp.]|jgi:cell division protein FtsN|uniref:HU domain-containing protein n=1 Tax=Mucilaginibacter sp. TaxID=1882438 RepID=UPI003561FE3F
MDVGYFISELLAQHGDVSVPGLGYFARTRINGHYNEKEGKLYPPTYSVQFDPQNIEDETLAQYIVDKKNISLASSKYFTEKFITNIKLQAQSAETALGDLGWFYTEGSQLYFRPNTGLSTDPDFFGYQPVNLHKLGSAPVVTEPAATPVEDEYTVPVAVPQQQEETDGYRFETDEEHEAYLVDLARKRSRNSTITFVVLALLFTSLVVYLVNRYNPSAFNLEAPKHKVTKTEAVINAKVEQPEDSTATAKDTAKTSVKPDTISTTKTTVIKDTLAKTPATANNNIAGPRYEILGGSFATIEEANRAIKNYKTLGIEARILENVPGRKRKVTLGTYATRAEAVAAQEKILSTKKVKEADTYIQPYNIK